MRQGNPNPIVPHEAGRATRFKAGPDPRRDNNTSRRTSTQFIQRRLNSLSEDGKSSINDSILTHLIEVATKWEVVITGRGSDGEMLKVASARESVDAAKLLWSYALGKPGKATEEGQLDRANHFLAVEKNRFAFALQLLGDRAKAMDEVELARFFNSLVVAKPESVSAFLDMAAGISHEEPPTQEVIPDGQQLECSSTIHPSTEPTDDSGESTA